MGSVINPDLMYLLAVILVILVTSLGMDLNFRPTQL